MRNKIHGFQIDLLRLCFEVECEELFKELTTYNVGEVYHFYEFDLVRIDGKHFEYVFEIRYYELEDYRLFGELKFGFNHNDEEANTHISGKRKAWISVSNRVLYTTDEFYYLDYIADTMCLSLHNITTIDLALDMSMNISRYLRRLIRCKSFDVILNGKKILDRKEDRPEIVYSMSGDLDRDKYLTTNIKQKKALNDKTRGCSLIAYNKLGEIENSSNKDYITEWYGNPKKLYRLEVHLNNDEIKDYLNKKRIELEIGMLYDEKVLFGLFYDTLKRLIRFQLNGKTIEWFDILEGVITTPPAGGKKAKKNISKAAS